jgi:hypothetical protein
MRAATAFLLLLLTLPGCAVPGPTIDPAFLADARVEADATTIIAQGDPNDLGAALGVALGKLNLAVVDARTLPSGVQRFDLVDVLDRPAELTIFPPTTQDTTFRIAAAFTRERRPDTERQLVAALAQRLAELRSVDIAPAR